ncbi:MAG: hypothetical protein SWO11_21535 [Thermodesulfobacteriota bacterium]|nr:hypothetical protein [Thermodesulfobacteriota bacterium]
MKYLILALMMIISIGVTPTVNSEDRITIIEKIVNTYAEKQSITGYYPKEVATAWEDVPWSKETFDPETGVTCYESGIHKEPTKWGIIQVPKREHAITGKKAVKCYKINFSRTK